MTEDKFFIDGHEFVLETHQGVRGSNGPITIKKTRGMLDRYSELAIEFQGGNVVEVGLWDGGSTAFFASLFQPRSLVGFELATRPLDDLDRFLEASMLREHVHVHLGVDQADADTLRSTITGECEGPLDLVIDDASHLLKPTTITFETLFPMLRAGGLYIIEDWSHEHQVASSIRRSLAAGTFPAKDLKKLAKSSIPTCPLSRLIIDIVLATANADGVIDEVILRPGFAEIRRGQANVDPDVFHLRDLIGELGRAVSPR